MTQPEALRLADELEMWTLGEPAAAELRRLHAEVERLSLDSVHTCHAECQRPLCRLTRERDALLEALHAMLSHTAMLDPSQGFDGFDHSAVNQARAAIKAVEGENT